MRLTSLMLLVALIGCTAEPQQKAGAILFDLPNLIDELVLNMDNKNHRTIKTFVLNGDFEIKEYESTDSSFWAIELSKLKEIDLNSPQLRDVLNINSNIKDDKSNLLIDEYLLPDNNIAPLKKFRVYYLEDTSEIRQIYVELNSDNLIAKSGTKINLWVNRYSEKLLIDSIQIIGNDKTLMQSARAYQITTRTIW